MRRTRLALIPALWLTLSGAVAPQQLDAIRGLAECRLESAPALAAIATLRVTATHEVEDGPRHRIVRNYALPAGLSVFGFPAGELSSLETIEGDESRIMMIATVTGPYPAIQSAALAAHRSPGCKDQEKDPSTCSVFALQGAGWRRSLLIGENEGKTDIACSYKPGR